MSTCATLSRELSEPLAATAATATTWLLVEQSGPWGAKALAESHLDAAVGRALEAAAAGTGVRVALIRRPGRHADCLPAARHEVIVAHTVPGRGWVRRAGVADPAELLALDFAALGAGEHGGFGAEHVGGPVALVCTNGRRDRCCALLGRPLAAELAVAGHSEVWEVTHLGGHRFSPTMLVLPYGYAYGRLTAESAKEVLAATAAGHMVPEWSRGCSGWERPGQAADHAVRLASGETGVDALALTQRPAGAGRWLVTVSHEDGRVWEVEIAEGASEPPRPESCGKAAGTPSRMTVTALREV
ncbi:sucrase ferredoxin [Streptomyces sp. CB01881]|uniref:sucrase ferredoxin n=1 Tax=Streptomyces sp. CB01881 TaxID=2078691 RepID=UPI000CDC02F3|nr:sucrase ferredoxin [Streptomyces sp. CB01881]AUY49575.1 sucrase ferredoxin [Streptomyces sp. CB01881]TYC72969.1 sucrase ferredoxin [Streptomyces sp. CB01881]